MTERPQKVSIWMKLHIDFILFVLIFTILALSLPIIWSASGHDNAMLERKIIQITLGVIVMVVMAQIPPKMYENWAIYFYITCIVLLILVDVKGQSSNGAQRWLNLGFVRFQPSELAKIAVPLMVARFVSQDNYSLSLKNIFLALFIILIPTGLVILQPDLGTAILIALSGLFILFLCGLSWRFIFSATLLAIAYIPIHWSYFMHEYQRSRVRMLFYAEQDSLGAGYHIDQSKVAIGSGGFYGKGWSNGTQSHLEFLPESHTDFIFSVFAEEQGFLGAILLLTLYLCMTLRGLYIASKAQTSFGRLLVGGLMLILCIYIVVNIGMVSGLLPVVGVPLPLISYGGSSLIVLMTGFGMVMSVHTHRRMLARSM